MNKSLLSKYFYICVSLILGSIIVLGVALLMFASQYFTQEKYTELERLVQRATAATNIDITFNNGMYQISPSLLGATYSVLGGVADADIYLVDSTGKTLVCTGDEDTCNHKIYLMDKEIIATAMTDGYQEMGRLNGIYDEGHFTVGIPLVAKDGSVLGAVFASTNSNSLTTFLIEVFKMFAISAVVVLVLAFFVIYFTTVNMLKPLTGMVKATESFSRGDFTVRVPVDSYDEIGRLSMAFNNMASSLALNESSRRSFLANVSHELRTPMTTIGGFVDGMLDGTIPPQKHEHYLSIVSDEVKRLTRLVRSMLNIAKMEAGEMDIHKTSFDLHNIVCTTVFTFEKAVDEKNLQVIGLDNGKVMVEADSDLIHQVIYNLLENAVKFANDGGYIEILYETDKEKGVYFGIKNSGDGISKEEIPRLFDRFYKTDKSRSLDKRGVGLGLHIVRSIINLHNTDIIVKSVVGEYCEFGFYLPAYQPKATNPLFRGRTQAE